MIDRVPDKERFGTENKRLVREHWNLIALKEWSRKPERGYRYFGLSGGEIMDIIAWQDVLSHEPWTAVEKWSEAEEQFHDVRSRMIELANLNDVPRPQILRGDIEAVILKGTDRFGVRPVHSILRKDEVGGEYIEFDYDLVNLDFCSGIGYNAKSRKDFRIEAIRELPRRVRRDFFLMLTVSVRDNIKEEMSDFLRDYKEFSADVRSLLDLHEKDSESHAIRLKAVISLFLFVVFSSNGYEVDLYPPVAYRGHNTTMAHFMVGCCLKRDNFPARGATERDILELPLVQVSNGGFSVQKFGLGTAMRRWQSLYPDIFGQMLD